MIGELRYMPRLNEISVRIVERAVAVWRETPDSVLVCESSPMTREALALGVDESAVVTALTQKHGHTTRKVALWLAETPYASRPVRIVTHVMHAPRAVRIFRKAGINASAIAIDVPFKAGDPDWKLRSAAIFRMYNLAAEVYCFARGWV
jgi:hypothetical protein